MIDKLHLDKNGTTEQKQSMIYNFLRERRFVLLLDGLWTHIDLSIIGIPDPMNIGTAKRKVVLTTRSTEVCGQMEVKKKIRVDVLEWEDAWSLFKEKVTEETIESHPLIQNFSIDVVKQLGGLPLAIITVGRTMQDKLDPSEWEHAVVLLNQARLNDLEMSSTNQLARAKQSVYHTLKFSYDSLNDDTLRQCFLHCSSWPEDYCILKDHLIEVWMGLGLIDEREIQESYNVGYRYITKLQAVCLLESDNDYSIKMHDVIRDMALWIVNNQEVDRNTWIVQEAESDESIEIELSHYTKNMAVRCARLVFFSIAFSTIKPSALLKCTLLDSEHFRLELFSNITFLNLSGNLLESFPAN